MLRCRALGGNLFCGDRALQWVTETATILCLVDGLGHGEQAEHAANQSLQYVASNLDRPLSEIIHGCNGAIRNTRGVAMGIVSIRRHDQIIEFAGVGNIHGAFLGKKTDRLFSIPGIVGGGFGQLAIQTAPLVDEVTVAMFTDGVTNDAYGVLARLSGDYDLDGAASTIERECGKDSDDMGILLYRCSE